MKHFLLVFDRPRGHLLKMTAYNSRSKAMRARFEAERLHRGDSSIEIVVLNSRSEAIVRSTHSRYFSDAREIARQGLDKVGDVRRDAQESGGRTPDPGFAV
jgi:hypothetical protein